MGLDGDRGQVVPDQQPLALVAIDPEKLRNPRVDHGDEAIIDSEGLQVGLVRTPS